MSEAPKLPSNIPNTFQHPNWLVDQVMYLLTPEENIVLTFAVRHILGWENERLARQKSISLTMFESGYTTPSGARYNGTNLGRPTILKILRTLSGFGLLVKVRKEKTGDVWKLPAEPEVKWADMVARYEQRYQKQQDRTRKVRAKRKVGVGKSHLPPTGTDGAVNDINQQKLIALTDAGKSHLLNQTQPNQPNPFFSPTPTTKREPLPFPVPGLTAQLLEEQAAKKNGSKKKKTTPKVEVVQVELTPLEEAIARCHYGWSVKDLSKWNQDRWTKLAEIKLAYEECGMTPEEIPVFKTWYEGDKDRFGWNLPGQANLCGWVGRWRATLGNSSSNQTAGDWTPLHQAYADATAAPASERGKILSLPTARIESFLLQEDELGNTALAPHKAILEALKGKAGQ